MTSDAVTPVSYPDLPADVAAAFETMPKVPRALLLRARSLIFQLSADIKGVGPVHETLKWGQPSYLTPVTKSGTTIRLGVTKAGQAAIFTHCQSSVMSDHQSLFPNDLDIQDNRLAIVAAPFNARRLRPLIVSALTYHLDKS